MKRRVAALVRTNSDSVHPDLGAIIHCSQMKQKTFSRPQFRPIKAASIPDSAKEPARIETTRRGFRAERIPSRRHLDQRRSPRFHSEKSSPLFGVAAEDTRGCPKRAKGQLTACRKREKKVNRPWFFHLQSNRQAQRQFLLARASLKESVRTGGTGVRS